MIRFDRIADLTDPDSLGAVLGPIRELRRAPLTTVGYTGALHERVELVLLSGEHRSLVIKRVGVLSDWTARRTEDKRGREAWLLAEPALTGIWNTFECPYLAFAMEPGGIGLLMSDLSESLFPDVREPIDESSEDLILAALASLHARYWSSPALDRDWLAKLRHYLGILDFQCASDPQSREALPSAMREGLVRGWSLTLGRLSRSAAQVITAPAEELAQEWANLPCTLVHGDVKLANLAVLPHHRVSAFDWALVGAAPALVDLGWYLAVNATRLARPKDEVLRRYRAYFSIPVPDDLWSALTKAGIIAGARMLLWSKALAVEADRPGARQEWNWWADTLDAVCT